MTDLQFKVFLSTYMRDLARIRAAGVSDEAAAEIDRVEARLQASLDETPKPELLDEDEEPNGLTDFQYVAWLRSVVGNLEYARAASDEATFDARLEDVIAELEKEQRLLLG